MHTEMIGRDRLAALLADAYEELCELREWPSLTPEGQAVERKQMSEIQAARVDTMALIAISRMDAENSALKRTVEDLAHALRNVSRIFEEKNEPRTAAYIRRTLDRHGLLRPVDRPEMTQVFREEPEENRERGRSALALGTAPADWTRYALACNLCGAPAGQACNLTCEDGR